MLMYYSSYIFFKIKKLDFPRNYSYLRLYHILLLYHEVSVSAIQLLENKSESYYSPFSMCIIL